MGLETDKSRGPSLLRKNVADRRSIQMGAFQQILELRQNRPGDSN
jgi:hypothetical protein